MKTIQVDLYPNGHIKAINVPGGYELKIVDHGSKLVVDSKTEFPGKKPEWDGKHIWTFKGYNLVRE